MAVANILHEFLPKKIGICRGFIVTREGKEAGDDIILFDQHRFPLLRPLSNDLTIKQRVPIEAVYAYIEAKHTLYVTSKGKTAGQSMSKAIKQVHDVKALHRDPVPLSQITPIIHLPEGSITRAHRGWPEINNPLYALIIARNICISGRRRTEPDTIEVSQSIVDARQQLMPDCLCAGSVIATPCYHQDEPEEFQLRPFFVQENKLLFSNSPHSFGIAMAHLLWAIENINLGTIQWPAVFLAAMGQFSATLQHKTTISPALTSEDDAVAGPIIN